jgi:adenylylsulfate kinase-like enzyme
MIDAGLITIVSFISPFISPRAIHGGTSSSRSISTRRWRWLEAPDPKGLYKEARRGVLHDA